MLSQPCSALCISLFLPLEDLTDRCQCTEHFGRIQKYIQDFLVFDSKQWRCNERMAKASCSGLPCFEFMLLDGDADLDCGKGHCCHGRRLCLLGLCGICLWPWKSFQSDASQKLLWCRAGHCVEVLAQLLASIRTLLWLECLQALRPNSLVWFGTKCSSWVSLCVSCSHRPPENMYHGDEERAFVL